MIVKGRRAWRVDPATKSTLVRNPLFNKSNFRLHRETPTLAHVWQMSYIGPSSKR